MEKNYTLERPSWDELEELIERYGEPFIIFWGYDMKDIEYVDDYPPCKGEAVLEIIDEDKVVGVRHRGGNEFVLPMGRVWESEGFMEGAVREAKEETGFDVELLEFKEIRKLEFTFSNAILERWHLLFTAQVIGGEGVPLDKYEIEEVKLMDDVPWATEYY
ncbi:MAG: NUDIX hydrolase [Thermoplasmata archaeon]